MSTPWTKAMSSPSRSRWPLNSPKTSWSTCANNRRLSPSSSSSPRPAGPKIDQFPTPQLPMRAIGIRNVVRRATRTTPRIHLFIAGPMGLALRLGHRWNRLRPTVVYEDVRTAQGYEAAFTVQA
ncbi:SAVED domain-containing protein [Streptomyces sp. NPDC029004]|uniref:SAVED domain-containing protein n=1 Tax=Streptomyces sp. NPDC029004 TaxID=3154490 RepID=UPI0034032749